MQVASLSLDFTCFQYFLEQLPIHIHFHNAASKRHAAQNIVLCNGWLQHIIEPDSTCIEDANLCLRSRHFHGLYHNVGKVGRIKPNTAFLKVEWKTAL